MVKYAHMGKNNHGLKYLDSGHKKIVVKSCVRLLRWVSGLLCSEYMYLKYATVSMSGGKISIQKRKYLK